MATTDFSREKKKKISRGLQNKIAQDNIAIIVAFDIDNRCIKKE
jgi:hypothetical protein